MIEDFIRYWTGKYTGNEIKQIKEISTLYNKYINNEDLPNSFKEIDLSDKTKRKEIDSNSCLIGYWEKKIGIGDNLQDEIKDLINIVCIYQTERIKTGRGYYDDPIHLFLHEFKLICVQISQKEYVAIVSLSACGCSRRPAGPRPASYGTP